MVCFLVIIVGSEEADALLDLAEHVDQLYWVLHGLIVVEDSCAFLLVLVVLLVLLDLANDTGEDQLTIQDDHTSLLEVLCASNNDPFVSLNSPEEALILLQELLLLIQLCRCFLNEAFKLCLWL